MQHEARPRPATARSGAVCLAFLCFFVAGAKAIRIDSIRPDKGGTAGGTRLTIFGEGFSGDPYTGRNVVIAGPQECDVIDYYSTAYMVVCETAAIEVEAEVSVQISAGGSTARHCCFEYREHLSPAVDDVSPRSAAPGSEITLSGPDSKDLDWGDEASVVDMVSVGGQLCDMSSEGGDEVFWLANNRFHLRCTLPDGIGISSGGTAGADSDEPGVGQGGNFDVSVRFSSGTSGESASGLARMHNRLADKAGNGYDLQVHPVVENVQPTQGSKAGGTLVTLTGRGFPHIAPGEGNSSDSSIDIVLPGGSGCKVVSSRPSQLECLTEPALSSPITQKALIIEPSEDNITKAMSQAFQSLFPGGRGASYSLWYNQSSNLGTVGEAITWDITSANVTSNVTSELEAPPRKAEDDNFVDTMQTFFIPPAKGDYQFFINVDDGAVLWAAFRNRSGHLHVSEIMRTGYASKGTWDGKENQISAIIELEADSPVHLHAARYENKGTDHLRIGAMMPSDSPRIDTVPEVQSIKITADSHGQRQALRVFYKTPVPESSVVSFTAQDLAVFNSPGVLVSLVIGDSSIEVPLTISPVDLEQRLSVMLEVAVEVVASCKGAEARWEISVDPAAGDLPQIVASIVSWGSAGGGGGGGGDAAGPNESQETASATPTAPPEGSTSTSAPNSPPTGPESRRRRQMLMSQDGSGDDSGGDDSSSAVRSWCGSTNSTLVSASPGSISVGVETLSNGVSPPLAGLRLYPAADPAAFVLVPAASDAEELKEAVEGLLGGLSEAFAGVEVSVEKKEISTSQPGVSGWEWLIEFPMLPPSGSSTEGPNSGGAFPVLGLMAPSEGDGPAGDDYRAEAEVKSQQTETFGGSLGIRLPSGNRASVTLPVDSTELEIKALLRDFAGVVCSAVGVSGSVEDGEITWELTFDPVAHFGDQPQLLVDVAELQGTNVAAVAQTLQNGKQAWFSRPIAGDYLRMPIPKPGGGIEVWVGGALASCEAGMGQCLFEYRDELTPRLDSVQPTEGTTGDIITITGSGFGETKSAVSVSFGGTGCTVEAVADGQITCKMQSGGTAGVHPVQVTIVGSGLAASNSPVEFKSRLLQLASVSPSSVALSGTSGTLLTITGAGFGSNDCSENSVTIGTEACSVLECSPSRLVCLFTSSGTAAAAAEETQETVTVVVIPAQDALQRRRRRLLMTESAQLENAVSLGGSTAAFLSTNGDQDLPSSGGTLRISLGGSLEAGAIRSVHLIPPLMASGKGTLAVSDGSIQEGEECVISPAISEPTSLECTTGLVRPGAYQALVTIQSGTRLVSLDSVAIVLEVSGVSPATGSMAGGTLLTISGRGFSSNKDDNVVLIPVPVSTTFPSGVILCDATEVTEAALVCRTRVHCAGNAKSFRPGSCKLQSTEPGEVLVALCSAGLSDTGKLRCVFTGEPPPVASCSSPPCSYSYSSTKTPTVADISPGVIQDLPTVLTLTGTNTDAVSEVTVGGEPCTIVTASAAGVTCAAPELPAGRHGVEMRARDGGSGWVTATIAYVASVSGISAEFLGLSGGLSLELTAAGAPWFDASAPERNEVSIGGVRCPVTRSSANKIWCETQPVIGRARLVYFELPWGTSSWPASTAGLVPSFVEYPESLKPYWAWSAPTEVLQYDYFLARISTWLLLPEAGNYTFQLSGDSLARLYIDGELVLEHKDEEGEEVASVSVTLVDGFRNAQLDVLEVRGKAGISMQWILPNATNATDIPPTMFFAVKPGQILDVEVSVAGLPATPRCLGHQKSLQVAAEPDEAELKRAAPAIIFESPERVMLSTQDGECALLYSTFATPVITSLSPSEITSGTEITVTGFSFGGANEAAVEFYNKAGDGGEHVLVAVCEESDAADTLVVCSAPELPAGQYSVALRRVGSGVSVNSFPVSYLPSLTAIAPSFGSMFGGTQVVVSGANLAGDDPTKLPDEGDEVTEAGLRSLSITMSDVPCSITAANSSEMLRCTTDQRGPEAGNRWTRVTVTAGGLSARLEDPQFIFHRDYTPFITEVSSIDGGTPPANSEFVLKALLEMPKMYPYPEEGIDAAAFREALAANLTMEIQTASGYQKCSEVSVVSFSAEGPLPVAQLQCSAPGIPGGTYGVRALLNSYGFSSTATLRIPLEVSGLSPAVSSLAGGRLVTITGSGFPLEADAVEIMVADVPAEVISSTGDVMIIATPELSEGEWNVTVRGFLQEEALNAGILRASLDLTPALEGLTPQRGSSAGGTTIELSLSNVPQGATTFSVLIGEAECLDISVKSSSGSSAVLECTTPPPEGSTAEALPVSVAVASAGLAQSDGAAYRYTDLWSARSTWGGDLPPFEGDSVVVPPGVTIQLDVSPPRLKALILEGTLEVDPAAADIKLDAEYIIIVGGALQVGTSAEPHQGHVTITLHGGPKSIELPIYGAKTIAVREGKLQLFGAPKRPSWTHLDRTVHPGETELLLSSAVDWVPGDVIVVSSSSFYAAEVDKAIITSVESAPGGRSVISLDRPLQYTHIGEVETIQGLVGHEGVFMKAEVAVLSRNVVVQGDEGSVRSQYGSQIMVHSPNSTDGPHAVLQMQDVEVRRAGQAFRLGRYPIHFHMHGDASESYVSHCVIHGTFNRALTVHGSHDTFVGHNVAFDNMGHAFFIEDGIETGNTFEGNLGIWTRRSHSLLNTDTTPATFWVTNPSNFIIGNTAAGSEAYGFWYRMLSHPEGPSFTEDVCPKFMPLGSFVNNVAHSNLVYGLRVFPEFYPNTEPCEPGKGDRSLAVFEGLQSYKNGMKGAIATQVGLVQFKNFTVADCGGGPFAHKVNGKDHGGGIEFTWIIDGRNRAETDIGNMTGVVSAAIVAKTALTLQHTSEERSAAQWPSGRGVRGLITQSLPLGTHESSAFMQASDVAWVNFEPSTGPQFRALEHCGKCKTFQGGQTTFLRGARFLQGSARPALASWSWPHQGIFLDSDGSVLGGPPGQTLHAGDNGLLEGEPLCRGAAAEGSPDGWICAPELVFRRVMLNNHKPNAMKFYDLLVTLEETNSTSRVQFSKYNDNGYQWTNAVARDHWLHWDTPTRLDPEQFSLHESEQMDPDSYMVFHTRHIKLWNHFKVNKEANKDTFEAPLESNAHGASVYSRLMLNNSWDGREDTTFSVMVAGTSYKRLTVKPSMCPVEGCPEDGLIPQPEPDYRQGKLLWSQASTWEDAGLPVPQDGDDVTIPEGWDVVLDADTPKLNRVTVAGNLTFGKLDLKLRAMAVLVAWGGRLQAGTPEEPHEHKAHIVLHGRKDSPVLAVDDEVVPGAKVLAVIKGGVLSLHGKPHETRWTRLGATAAAGSDKLQLEEPVDWEPGSRVVIASSTFNPDQAEVSVIATSAGSRVLMLEEPLRHEHSVLSSGEAAAASEGAPSSRPSLSPEVGLLGSNIVIESDDGEYQNMEPAGAADPYQGQKFGAYVLVHGDDTSVKLSEVAMNYCGQFGIQDGNGCVRVLGGALAPDSYIQSSSVFTALDHGIRVEEEASGGLRIEGNVLFGSSDMHTVHVGSSGNVISNNLALGTTKAMEGKSSFDKDLPATFSVMAPGNVVKGNAAAGSHRAGFRVVGAALSMDECAAGHPDAKADFDNNVAHSSLVGLLLEGSPGASCTGVRRFAAWRNWDFGVLAGLQGIGTSVLLEEVTAANSRHAGILVLKKGRATEDHEANIIGGLIRGQVGGKGACGPCPSFQEAGKGGEEGCHPRLSRVSYTEGPSYGLVSATFAMAFTPGPEQKPWDGLMGYPTVLGRARITGTAFEDFFGEDGCGSGSFAITNHAKAPDAFHPHEFSGIRLSNVDVGNGALLKLHGPDPSWRNPSDCGTATFTGPDGTKVDLNCDGPKHILLKDLDGSLFGSRGANATQTGSSSVLLGVSAGGANRPLIAQGAPINEGPCPVASGLADAYSCRPGWNTTLTEEQPAKGFWGEPELLVMESLDKDTEDRNFGPVLLESAGVTDLLTPCMDHGWCFGYTCQKRLSTYWMTVAADQEHAINTTGTPPRNMRLWFPYARKDAEVVLVINYFEIQRRYLWLEGAGRIGPASTIPTVGDGQPHGAYTWQQAEGLLTVKVTGGGRMLEVRTEAVVNINAHLAISFEEFFEDEFVQNVAAVLQIDSSRIKMVQVVPGSVIVDFQVGEDPAVMNNPLPEVEIDTSLNVDSDTQAALRGDSAAQEAYLAQLKEEMANSTLSSSAGGQPLPPQAPEAPNGALDRVLKRLNDTVSDGSFAAAAGGDVLSMLVVYDPGNAVEDNTTFVLEQDQESSPGGEGGGGIPVALVAGVSAALVSLLLVAAALGLLVLRRRAAKNQRTLTTSSSLRDITTKKTDGVEDEDDDASRRRVIPYSERAGAGPQVPSPQLIGQKARKRAALGLSIADSEHTGLEEESAKSPKHQVGPKASSLYQAGNPGSIFRSLSLSRKSSKEPDGGRIEDDAKALLGGIDELPSGSPWKAPGSHMKRHEIQMTEAEQRVAETAFSRSGRGAAAAPAKSDWEDIPLPVMPPQGRRRKQNQQQPGSSLMDGSTGGYALGITGHGGGSHSGGYSADLNATDREQHGDRRFKSGGADLATTGTGLLSSAESDDILGPLLRVPAGMQGRRQQQQQQHKGSSSSSPLPPSGATHGAQQVNSGGPPADIPGFKQSVLAEVTLAGLGTDTGIRAASKYTYDKQGEAYGGVVVQPARGKATAGAALATSSDLAFQQSDLYKARFEGDSGASAISRHKDDKLQDLTKAGREAGSVRGSSVETARFVSFGGAALDSDDNQGDARARTPLDPVALMRQQSDGVAEKTAAAALLTVQSGNDRTAANNRAPLNLEEVLQTEDAGVLAAVNALKREQSLKERDELAMRNLAKQYRPNEEIDQFAKEVIPSPSGPHRPTGPNEWDK